MEQGTKQHRIFVYNSLKQGFVWHNEYLGNGQSKYLGAFTSGPNFSLYIDALPFMVAEPSNTGVRGEVFEIDDSILKRLDGLEKCPRFVKREMIEVVDETGELVRAWAYIYPNRFKHKEWIYKEFEWV
jgi:gamma-glutamylaminecyclotransferase